MLKDYDCKFPDWERLFEDENDLSIDIYDQGGSSVGLEERKLEITVDTGTNSPICPEWSRTLDSVWSGMDSGIGRGEEKNNGGGTQVQLLYTTRSYKNV